MRNPEAHSPQLEPTTSPELPLNIPLDEVCKDILRSNALFPKHWAVDMWEGGATVVVIEASTGTPMGQFVHPIGEIYGIEGPDNEVGGRPADLRDDAIRKAFLRKRLDETQNYYLQGGLQRQHNRDYLSTQYAGRITRGEAKFFIEDVDLIVGVSGAGLTHYFKSQLDPIYSNALQAITYLRGTDPRLSKQLESSLAHHLSGRGDEIFAQQIAKRLPKLIAGAPKPSPNIIKLPNDLVNLGWMH